MVRGLTTVAFGAALVVAAAGIAAAEGPKPWLGITFQPGTLGARIIEVHPGTGAAAAGLQPGDEITLVAGEVIVPGGELSPLVSTKKIGGRLSITFVRRGRSFRVAPRLTPRPTSDEIVYQGLIDHDLPSLELFDRQGAAVPASEQRRPMVWLVFDARCEHCGGGGTQLSQRLDETLGTQVAGGALLRVVIVGGKEEVDAYLTRSPVVGTVWRIDRVEREEAAWSGRKGGGLLLPGIEPHTDGTVLVVDARGAVTFATTVSAGADVLDGACAAVSRLVSGRRHP